MAKFGLLPLQQRRKQQRLELLMRILSREDTHPALIELYDELVRRPGQFYTNQSSVSWTPYFHASKQQPILQQLSTKDRTRAQGKQLNIAVSCNVVLQANT